MFQLSVPLWDILREPNKITKMTASKDSLLAGLDVAQQIAIISGTSALSSAVAYLVQVKNGAPFKIFALFVNILVATLVAVSVFMFLRDLEPTWSGDSLIGAMVPIGILANKIFEIVEERGLRLLVKKMLKADADDLLNPPPSSNGQP